MQTVLLKTIISFILEENQKMITNELKKICGEIQKINDPNEVLDCLRKHYQNSQSHKDEDTSNCLVLIFKNIKDNLKLTEHQYSIIEGIFLAENNKTIQDREKIRRPTFLCFTQTSSDTLNTNSKNNFTLKN